MAGGRSAAALATAVVALQPQLLHLTGVKINPDLLLAAQFWTRHSTSRWSWSSEASPRSGWKALMGLCALAGFTHGRGLALLLPVAVALALRLWKENAGRTVGPWSDHRRRAGRWGALRLWGRAQVIVAMSNEPTLTQTRRLASYIVAVLPAEAVVHDSRRSARRTTAFGKSPTVEYYGAFAQLEIAFGRPCCVRRDLVDDHGVVAVAAVVALVRRRREWLPHWDVAVVLAAAVLGLLGLLHAVAYRSMVSLPADPIITGRYLFPLAALSGVALAVAVSLFPRPLARGGGWRYRGGARRSCSFRRASASRWSASMRRAELSLAGCSCWTMGFAALRGVSILDAGPRGAHDDAAASAAPACLALVPLQAGDEACIDDAVFDGGALGAHS